MNIRIRQEESTELPAICKLIEVAFADMQESDHQEHHLVDKLHKSDTYIPELSLIAKTDQEDIVGYILLTKVKSFQRVKSIHLWLQLRLPFFLNTRIEA